MATETMTERVASLLTNPKYHDLEIKCGPMSFRVHRAIVCAQSKVFARECESAFHESANFTIQHDIFDGATLERVLQFMYTGDYKVTAAASAVVGSSSIDRINCATSETNDDVAAVHILVYASAQFYEMPQLEQLAIQRLNQQKFTDPEKFLRSASTAFSVTCKVEDNLRMALIQKLFDDHAEWLQSSNFWRLLLKSSDLHEFAAGVAEHMATKFKKAGSHGEEGPKQEVGEIEMLRSELRERDVAFLQEKEALQLSAEEVTSLNSQLREVEASLEKERSAVKKAEEKPTRSADQDFKDRAMLRLQLDEARGRLEAKSIALEQAEQKAERRGDQTSKQVAELRSRLSETYKKLEEKAMALEQAEQKAQRQVELREQKEVAVDEADDKARRCANENAALRAELVRVNDEAGKARRFKQEKLSLSAELQKAKEAHLVAESASAAAVVKANENATTLFATVANTQQELRKARDDLNTANWRLKTTPTTDPYLTQVINLVTQTQWCRNCSEECNWTMEANNEGGQGYMLRCGVCRCRHFGQ